MIRQTISEKILSRASGKHLSAGDFAFCKAHSALATDGSLPMAIDYLRRLGTTLHHTIGQRLIVACDHYAPAPSRKASDLHEVIRNFCREHEAVLYDVGKGIGHQLMLENGHILPNELVIGADSHAVSYGALNAFGTGVGSSDLAGFIATGQVWLRVPETIQVRLHGELAHGVSAKDLALSLIGKLKANGAAYQAIEFGGAGVATLDMADRITISNMVVEMGAKAGVFPCDSVTQTYLAAIEHSQPYRPAESDPGATYISCLDIELEAIEPVVSVPSQVDNVRPISEVPRTRITSAYIGTCTGGRVKDFQQALEVLRKTGGIADGVKLYVTPASNRILAALVRTGVLDELLQMGAVLGTPGCGACCGTCGAIPPSGQNVMSTANRNFLGRMGNAQARIYLASAASCAAAAGTGYICDPRGIEA